MINIYTKEQRIKNTILDLAQKERQVVYGQQSVNIQLPSKFRRETKDYDIFTKKPKQMAEKLAKQLNKIYGEGEFNVEEALHKGTFKVKSKEGKTVVDYTLSRKKPKYKEIWGIKYADINYSKEKLNRIIKDEGKKFRHEKDLETLNKIRKGDIRKW